MEAIFRVKEAWSKHLRNLETFAHTFENCLSPRPPLLTRLEKVVSIRKSS